MLDNKSIYIYESSEQYFQLKTVWVQEPGTTVLPDLQNSAPHVQGSNAVLQNNHRATRGRNKYYYIQNVQKEENKSVALSVFKIKPKEHTRSREPPVPQNIPSAGGVCNLPWLLTAARAIANIKYKPINSFLPSVPLKSRFWAADIIHC